MQISEFVQIGEIRISALGDLGVLARTIPEAPYNNHSIGRSAIKSTAKRFHQLTPGSLLCIMTPFSCGSSHSMAPDAFKRTR